MNESKLKHEDRPAAVVLAGRQRIKEASALRSHFIRCLACLVRNPQRLLWSISNGACFKKNNTLAPSVKAGHQWRSGIFLKHGQQVLEYAMFAAVVSIVLLAMYVYAKRGIQNVIKISADQIGPQGDSEPLASITAFENTTSVSETLTSGKTQIDVVGEERVLNTQSESIGTGLSTITIEERIE